MVDFEIKRSDGNDEQNKVNNIKIKRVTRLQVSRFITSILSPAKYINGRKVPIVYLCYSNTLNVRTQKSAETFV